MKYFYFYSQNNVENYRFELDSDQITNAIETNKRLYRNMPNLKYFFNDWEIALLKTYESERNKTLILRNSMFFYEPIIIDGFEMRIHFNIDKAIELSDLINSQKIPLGIIGEKQTSTFAPLIKYSSIANLKSFEHFSNCTEPILLVNFCHNGFFYLVIDGNHRITSMKKEHRKSVDAKLLPNVLVDKIFYSSFEKAIYYFLFEGFQISRGNFTIIEESQSKRFIYT